METFDKLFVNKYQPLIFDDFGIDEEIIKILKTLILMEQKLKNIFPMKKNLLSLICPFML